MARVPVHCYSAPVARFHPVPMRGEAWTRDSDFIALLPKYRLSGGLATAAEVAARMRRAGKGDLASLHGSIAEQRVIAFEWSGSTWLPWAQFDLANMSLQQGARAIISELGGVLDGWELAEWLVQPNAVLNGMPPVDRLACDPAPLVAAARLARFIAKG